MTDTRIWTPAQTLAMETKGRTLLISAAAGSGKTATLTERIIRRLTDAEHPVKLSRLLIVTFTRAAASELKERIGKALAEAIRKDPGNRHLQEEIIALSSAHISTIDAFVREPVKAHFAELGLPASTRIADEAELMPLREHVMGELIEEYYRKYAAAPSGELFSLLAENPFADLCDSLCPSKNDEALIPAFLSLYERLLAFPAELGRLQTEAEELERCADGDFFATSHGTVLQEWLSDFCTSALTLLTEACRAIAADEAAAKAYGSAFESDRAFVEKLSEVTTYAEAYVLFSTYQNGRLKALRNASDEMIAFKETRTDIVGAIKKLAKTYFVDSPEAVSLQMRKTALMCRVLSDFLTAYDARILAEKQARGICDFTDNRRYLLRLLKGPDGLPTPFADELAKQYDEVYIDEYQDVDELQDEIFRLVGGNHRFMVGDIKQSIYGFRGADPSVFARYRRDLPMLSEIGEDPRGNSIFMSDNFRCDESVIRVTNAVCGHILRACPASVGYVDADDLGFAKKLPSSTYTAPAVEITILTKPPKSDEDEPDEQSPESTEPNGDEDVADLSALTAEATYVANRIAAMLREGTPLANGQPVRPRDIAILMRAGTALSAFREALTNMGIPTGSDELDAKEAGRDILHGGDMMYLVNLLRVIDDPDEDIPLSEILRAPYPGFSLEDVIAIRRADDRATKGYSLFECLETYPAAPEGGDNRLFARVCDFLSWIEGYRDLCKTQTAEGILRLLGRDDRCASRSTDAYRYLYESARTCHTSAFVSLYTFLRYFEKKLLTTQNVVAASADEDEGGHVSLMTIHKSKGLEFPVCFVVRCGHAFSNQSQTQDLIFEKRVGVAMKLYRRGMKTETATTPTQAKVDTTLRASAALAVRLAEREEEMRVLYVAMTRARERLCMVGSGNDKSVSFAEGDRYAALSCNSYLSWILGGLHAHPEIAVFHRLQFISRDEVLPGERLSLSRVAHRTDAETEIVDRYRHAFSLRREPTAMDMRLGQVPTKVPASRMSRFLLDECICFDTNQAPDSDGKLPDASVVDGDTWCDAGTVKALRESLRLMASSDEDSVNEFELLLGENKRPTAAERGTAAHLFLQFCDHERVMTNGIDEEIARLAEEGFLNARTVQVLDRSMLRGFFESRFFEHIRTAVTVERERKFSRFIPLSALTKDSAFAEALGDRTLYIQGSVDLVCTFADGHIEICDYKTDHITEAEHQDPARLADRMAERHGEQLRQYAEAVTDMYGKCPTRVYIYSLPLCEAVEITL